MTLRKDNILDLDQVLQDTLSSWQTNSIKVPRANQ